MNNVMWKEVLLFLNKTYFRDSGFPLPTLWTLEAMLVQWYTPCHHLETSSFRWPLGIDETEIYLSFAKLLRFWNGLCLQHDLSFINEGFSPTAGDHVLWPTLHSACFSVRTGTSKDVELAPHLCHEYYSSFHKMAAWGSARNAKNRETSHWRVLCM